MRATLPGKVFAAFAILLFTFGGVTVFSVTQVRRLGAEVGQLHATLLPLPARVAGMTRDLQQLELLLEQSEPAALRRGVHLARRVRPSLERLAEGFAEVSARLQAADSALIAEFGHLEERRAELGETMTRFFDRVEADASLEADRPPARRALRSMRRGLARFEVDLVAAIDREIAAVVDTEQDATWAAILLGAVAMVIGVLLTWSTRRLLRPLETLRIGVERVARGEYGPVEVEGQGELAALAADFNRMAAAIQGRDAQLNQQQKELLHQERLATVGRMSAQITHELRNPLSSIGLNSELLLDDLDADHPGRPLLESIIREVERLREITEEYLRFARLPRPERRPVDLNQACEELLEFVRSEMSQAQVKLRLDPDRAARPAFVDPSQLRAALLNLLRNAREAISGAGHIVVRVRTLGRDAAISVIDDGPGIDPEAMERIYEPFFSTKPQGTGLGLPMVQKIVSAQQGRMTVESTPGHGTTVTLLLPLAQVGDP